MCPSTTARCARLPASRAALLPKEKILCIGDGVETDLKGAHNAGFRSVFIASPIFLPDGLSAPALTKLFADRPFAPIAALPALAW